MCNSVDIKVLRDYVRDTETFNNCAENENRNQLEMRKMKTEHQGESNTAILIVLLRASKQNRKQNNKPLKITETTNGSGLKKPTLTSTSIGIRFQASSVEQLEDNRICHGAAATLPEFEQKHMNKTKHGKEQTKFSKCTNFQSQTKVL